MYIPERKTKADKAVVKQTFIQLVLEVFLSIIFGDIVTKLTGGIVLLITGPIIYSFNSDQKIGVILGIILPVIGLFMVVSEVKAIIKENRKNKSGAVEK